MCVCGCVGVCVCESVCVCVRCVSVWGVCVCVIVRLFALLLLLWY